MVYKSGQIFLPFCHNSRVWQTDRQTDRILTARPRLHSMQRGKNATYSQKFAVSSKVIVVLQGQYHASWPCTKSVA